MRWLALALVLVACGGEDRVATVDVPAQQLVVPPLDAGAAPSQTAAVAVEPPPPVANEPPPNLEPDARDPRVKAPPRQRALLDTEVQGLERLLANTPPGQGSSRPLLLKRVANSYAEIARGASETDAQQARQKEIARWTTMINDHPTFAGIDEARYYRGLAQELNGDTRAARSSYYDLIKNSPQSRFIPYAYFAFGELFFGEAKADPSKNALAEQAFKEVMKYPAAGNGMFALALLRLGETQLRLGEPAKAQTHFDRLRREFPSSAATTRIPP